MLAAALAWATLGAKSIQQPDWATKPSSEDIGRSYPLLANSLRLEGFTVLRCRVDPQGALKDCKATDERPDGLGFGAAALTMVDRFRINPKTIDGLPAEGGKVSIPIRFRQHPAPPEPPPLSPTPEALALARQMMAAQDAERGIDASINRARDRLLHVSMPGVSDAARRRGVDALMAAAESSKADEVDLRAKIYATVFPVEEMKAHTAFAATSAARVLRERSAELRALSAKRQRAHSLAVRRAAHDIFCAQIDCRAERDFANGRAPANETSTVYEPTWTQQPSEDQILRAYPVVAKMLLVEGYAGLVCHSTSLGMLDQCRVYAESPAGLGFGAAAISNAGLYRLRLGTAQTATPRTVWVVQRFHEVLAPPEPATFPATTERMLDLGRQIVALDQSVMRDFASTAFLKMIEQSPSPGLSPATVKLARDSFQAAMAIRERENADAMAAYYTSMLDEDQLREVLAHASSPAARIMGQRQVTLVIEMARYGGAAEIKRAAVARAAFCRGFACD
jgi:TonB family protein